MTRDEMDGAARDLTSKAGQVTRRYAVSVLAIREQVSAGRRDIQGNHSVFLVDALSEIEAEGLGLRIARKVFLTKDGWQCWDAKACPATSSPVTEEGARLTAR